MKKIHKNRKNHFFKKGHKHSQETIDKIKKNLPKRTGSKAPGWKGGIYPQTMLERCSNKNKEFRERVFERDDYTCQICGQIGGNLNCHHIKSWSKYKELRFSFDNVITLCVECHRKIHKKSIGDLIIKK